MFARLLKLTRISMATRICPHCGSSNTDKSPHGITICYDCRRSGW